jgi:hypothetical protein
VTTITDLADNIYEYARVKGTRGCTRQEIATVMTYYTMADIEQGIHEGMKRIDVLGDKIYTRAALLFRALFCYRHAVDDFSVAMFVHHYQPTERMTRAAWGKRGVDVLHNIEAEGRR